jgi:hypothetical protein
MRSAAVINYRGEARAGLSVAGPRDRMCSRQAEIEMLVVRAARVASAASARDHRSALYPHHPDEQTPGQINETV